MKKVRFYATLVAIACAGICFGLAAATIRQTGATLSVALLGLAASGITIWASNTRVG